MPSTVPTGVRRRARFAAAALLLALLSVVPATAPPDARAEVPAGTPVFSSPLTFSHPLFPFEPGAVKVYSGRDSGVPITVVETHLAEVRDFAWNATSIPCRAIEEIAFEHGRAVERGRLFVAQADDGSVWAFGEVEDADEAGDDPEDEGEGNGWIVGAARPEDPPDLTVALGPALLIPAAPAEGDQWMSEDAPPGFLRRSRVVPFRGAVRSRTGRYRDCVAIRDTDLLDGGQETKWFAPNLGFVASRAARERLVLQASTIRRAR